MLMPKRDMLSCHAIAWWGMLSYSTPSISKSTALGRKCPKPCFSKYRLIFSFSMYLLQSLTYCLAFSLITGLVEQGKHILLVGLYTRLIEGVDLLEQAADTASYLKEVDKLAEVICGKFRNADENIGYSAIHMGHASTELGHFVDLIHTLSGEEVEPVEVLFIVREVHFVAW